MKIWKPCYALRFIDGFDYYSTADLSRKWTSQNNPSKVSINNGASPSPRTGNGQLRIEEGFGGSYLRKVLDLQSTWIVGFGAYFSSSSLSNQKFFDLVEDSVTSHVEIELTTSGSIKARRGDSTLLGESSSGVITANTWHFIEVKCTIDNTSGVVVVKVDGSEVLNLTGQDTQNGGSASADAISLWAPNSGATTYFDDLYICDGTGSIRNDFLGVCKVETLHPNGNGNSNQFTGSDADSTDNYLHVDETNTDDDTSYVESSTSGHRDDYAFGDMAATPGSIHGVATNIVVKKDDSGARTVDVYARIGATDYDAAIDESIAESYVNKQHIWEQNPADSLDWEKADVDGANFGIEVAS